MYDHKYKKWAIIASLIAMAAMLGEKFVGFIIFKKLTAAQHYVLFEWVMLLSMSIIMYCREKYDDDRAKQIRLKSLQIAFLAVLATMMAVGLTISISPEPGVKDGSSIPAQILLTLAAFGIVLYLLIFHLGLYFDFLWDYNDSGVIENLKNIGKNVWSLVAYLIISIIALGVVIFL